MKGLFITFEGSESCGKSTQARLLYRYLKQQGYKVIFLREPGGTKISEKIRRILLDPKNRAMDKVTELLLYMASRSQTVQEVIAPALKQGKIVLCDRFLDSTLVYQGYGLGMDLGLIGQLGKFATAGISPDLTLLLDFPLKQALNNIGLKKDRIEQRNYNYHLRVRRGYMTLARKYPQRIKVVRLQDSKLATQKIIRDIVIGVIANKSRRDGIVCRHHLNGAY